MRLAQSSLSSLSPSPTRGRLGRMEHPELGTVAYSVVEVPEGGDSQTGAVVELMRRYALEDSSSLEVTQDLAKALGECPGCGVVEAVFWWVKRHIRFVRDEHTAGPVQEGIDPGSGGVVVEALIRPRDMAVLISQGVAQGDCDDFSMYTASLLTAAGVECSFVTVAADASSTDYSHVYTAAYVDGIRIPMDTSHGPRPGWETDKAGRLAEWPVRGGAILPLLVILAIGGIALCRW